MPDGIGPAQGKTWTAYRRLPDGSQKTKGGFPTEEEALKAGEYAEALANPPEYIEVHAVQKRGKVTVAGYAPTWLDGLLVEPNTRLAYGLSLKHIIACIGSVAVADVDDDDIRKIVRHMESSVWRTTRSATPWWSRT